MTISSVSTVYKVYGAGSGQKNAKQSRHGHHHAFDEPKAGSASAPTTGASVTGAPDGDGGDEGSIGKAIDVTA